MDLGRKNKINAAFSMSSMTDVIFLLLIFFMLTSNFITPAGLPVNYPSAEASLINLQEVSVTISADLEYAVNGKVSSYNRLQSDLQTALEGAEKGKVTLHIDKSVPTEYFVHVAGIATKLNADVAIATQPVE